MDFIEENIEITMMALASIVLLFIILFVIMIIQYTKLRRNYLKMMKGTQVSDFEKTMIQIQEELAQLHKGQKANSGRIDDNRNTIMKLKANIGMVRYNAFGQQGNDLSFSIALIDQDRNGIVLTGIHNREESYMYAKPLEQGASSYALSPEEKEAISRAVKTVQHQHGVN
jgi:hypothetical protein